MSEAVPYSTPYTDHFLRAPGSPTQKRPGNLQYLDFIDLVRSMWESAFPSSNPKNPPIVTSGGEQFARYPSIVYSLQLRKAHPGEPKPKYRDEIITNPDEDGLIICGQRFQNVVAFSVVHDEDPRVAEEWVEVFEDFMLEYTPIFKQMGLSEIVYARRLPDDDQPRVAEGVNKRTTSYLVTTEKIIKTSYDKWRAMLVRARMAMDHAVTFTTIGDEFVIYGASFPTGQTVTLDIAAGLEDEFPVFRDPETGETLRPGGTYHIRAQVSGPDNSLHYRLSAKYDSVPFVSEADGRGVITAIGELTDSVDIVMEDDFQSPASVTP
jgi:hypothetical protein